MRCLVAACTALSLAACGPDRAEPLDVELPALIPVPLHVQYGEGVYRLAADSRISGVANTDMHATLEWMIGLINEQVGLSLSLTDGPGALRLELEDSAAFAETLAAIDARGVREAYLLEITNDGIRIAASDEAGLFYGVTTLWQLLTANSNGELPLVMIVDAPEFEWRGVMLDSARHMQSPAFIKRYIDWMALHKLNVFHWHLTDDQAWRLEIRKYPNLTDVGAWRVPAGDAPAADIDEATGEPRKYGGYYSQETVRDIVAHAASRHVTIVPEIDVPGHATAAIAAYPELGVPGHGVDRVSASWGIFENVFNLEEDTFRFLEHVLSEVTELFPGEYIHLGGDEVVTKQWLASGRIAERMQELGVNDIQALQNYYVERLQDYLSTLGRKVIGWDEILESELPPEAAVMSWRGVEGAVAAAAKGHKTVLSPAPTFYLDHVQTNAPGTPPGRGGIVTTEDIYEFDITPDSLKENRDFLLGLQANVWTEHIRTEDRVVYMSFPRILAIAELGWSAPRNRSWASFAERLERHGGRLDALGIRSRGPAAREPHVPRTARLTSRELELCSNAIVLALEDDAPLEGHRESFLVDIMNPCWILEDVDLSVAESVAASVGQLPFNFEIGDMIDDVVVESPDSGDGELRVRLGSCNGPVVASLPLVPAFGKHGVTELPAARLELPEGASDSRDLCFSFTRHGVEPMWVVNWVEVFGDVSGDSQ
jgi:hexosaminidase